jgi:O-antigen ligase
MAAAVGKLAGACFALRGAVPMVCVRLLHLEPNAGSAVSLATGPALLLLLIFHSVGSAIRVENHSQRISLWHIPVTRWLAAYLAFAGSSLLWSNAVSPLSSSAYWCGLLLDAVVILLLLSLYPIRDVADSILHGYVLGACAVVALAWLMPSQADLRLGDPEFFNTNQIANVCAFGIFFAQLLQRRGRKRQWLPILAMSVTLLRTLSKTTLLAFLLSQCILLFRDPNISKRTRRRVLLSATAVLIASSGLLLSYYDLYTNASNQAETLTGRTGIWAWAIEKIPERPWTGHGFDSMWKVMPPFGSDGFEARHAENELLQQLYAYGIVGTILFVGVYVGLYRSFQRSPKNKIRPLLKAFLLFIVVRGVAEAEPFDLLLPVWALLLLAAVAQDGGKSADGISSTPDPRAYDFAVAIPEAATPVSRLLILVIAITVCLG